MTRPLRRPFPLEPLEDYAHSHGHNDLSRILGGGGLASARVRGFSAFHADRLAVRLGAHPSEIWGSWWTESAVDLIRELA